MDRIGVVGMAGFIGATWQLANQALGAGRNVTDCGVLDGYSMA